MAIAISAVINTRNEEANIEGCLECIRDHVDEIVISDMHSTDRTVELCRKYTNRIAFQPKRDMVDSVREEGILRAKNDWIFVIDCDERVRPDLFTKLREVAAAGDARIVRIHRRNFFCGIDLTGRGWASEFIERFFKKGSLRFPDHPHQWAECFEPSICLPPDPSYSIIHNAHPEIRTFIKKMNGYTESEARLMNQLGWRPNFKLLALRPAKMFFRHYVRLKGFSAGKVGFTFSSLMAVYWFVAALKLGELQRRTSAAESSRGNSF